MMRRKLSFVGNECCDAVDGGGGGLVESDIQRQLRDRFDDECPYALSRKSTIRSPKTRSSSNCNSQVWQVAVNAVAKKRETFRRSVGTMFRSMNKIRTGFRMAAQKLRPATRRRFKLDESPLTPNTPKTRSKCLLGRTPTKLYSPFVIDTPPSMRRRFTCRRIRYAESESNTSVNGKSESNSYESVNNENKQPKVNSSKEVDNYGSLI